MAGDVAMNAPGNTPIRIWPHSVFFKPMVGTRCLFGKAMCACQPAEVAAMPTEFGVDSKKGNWATYQTKTI